MTKVNLSINEFKRDIKEQYQWSVTRLQAILDEPSWTNQKIIDAVKDEARIQLGILKRLKQLSDLH